MRVSFKRKFEPVIENRRQKPFYRCANKNAVFKSLRAKDVRLLDILNKGPVWEFLL